MKRALVVGVLTLTMLFAMAAPALATDYHYYTTFYHLSYANPLVTVSGLTRCMGAQRQLSGSKPTGIRYALVTSVSRDPAQDRVHTWKSVYGNVGYAFGFSALSRKDVRLRFWNLNYEGNWLGRNKVATGGTFSGAYKIQ